MVGLIRTETATLATPDGFYSWLAARQGEELQLRLPGAGRLTGRAVMRTRFPTRSPRSVTASIWVMEAGNEWRAILLGHVRMVAGAAGLPAKLCFDGRARSRGDRRGSPAAEVRAEGDSLARQVLIAIASEVESRILTQVRLSA